MQLTPLLKSLIIAYAFVTGMAMLIWTGIKIDVLGLGLRPEWFNIGLVVIVVLDKGATALLTYLGLKAPTIGQHIINDNE